MLSATNFAGHFDFFLCLVSHKRGIDKESRPSSNSAECGIWLGSTLFVLNTWISIKHGYNENIANGPV